MGDCQTNVFIIDNWATLNQEDNRMQDNQSVMENREILIPMNNVEAQWIPVKGKLKMKHVMKFHHKDR